MIEDEPEFVENVLTGESKEEYLWLVMDQEDYLTYDDPDVY